MNKFFWVGLLSLKSLISCLTLNAQERIRVIPPSPTAASLSSFGDIPVGYYTGTPDISVPLYEIKSGSLSLPITLSYNATGIRVAQDASWVGLGWALSAGGVITRIIRGKQDFDGYYNNEKLPRWDEDNQYFRGSPGVGYFGPMDPQSDSLASHDALYFAQIKKGAFDGEPDIFSYNFGPYSGKFVIDKKSNGGKVFGVKRDNLDITFEEDGGSFTITTPEGIKYIFGTSEFVLSGYIDNWMMNPSTVVAFNNFTSGHLNANSSWYLDKIIAPNGDRIDFKYKKGKSFSLARQYEKEFWTLFPFSGMDDQQIHPYRYVSRELIEDTYLSKIEFSNGWVDFETSDRSDIEAVPGDPRKPQRLSTIKVYNSTDLIKEITLGQTYFNSTATSYSGKRLKLDYVQTGATAANRYSFSYYDADMLPNKYSQQADQWGFYTYPNQAPSAYHTLLPTVTYQDINGDHFIQGVEQYPDEEGQYVKKGILTSITYPTKGRTEFDYEPHMFQYGIPTYTTMPYTAIVDRTDPYPENHFDEPVKTFTLSTNTLVMFDLLTNYQENEAYLAYLKNEAGVYFFLFTKANISEHKLLEAGTYTIGVIEKTNYHVELRATYQVQSGISRKGNGLRVKSITNYDNNNHIAAKKNFFYTYTGAPEDVGSSGLLLVSPKKYCFKDFDYGEIEGDAFANRNAGRCLIRASSSAEAPGFDYQPNVVGYSKVRVIDSESGGSTIYNYYNEEADNYDPFPEIPLKFDSRNGQLLSTEVYNAAGHLVNKTEYEYQLKEKFSIKGAKVYKAPFDNTEYFTYDNDVRYYDNFSEWWIQSKKTETNYLTNQ